ncbi:MAG: hypothetical protein V4717_24360 [Bacteroidota bacterium]
MAGINEKVYDRIILYIIGLPVLFLLLFIVVSMLQLREINSRIEEGQSQTIKEITRSLTSKDSMSETHMQFLALAVLEEESLGERYRQGHYSLVSRSFRQFLGFFTGIIMVIVGSVFVLLKLREEINAGGEQGDGWKFTLVTNSPGVAFGIVGAVLIAIASATSDKINVSDSGLYLTREFLVAPFFSEGRSEADLNEYMRSQHQDRDEGDDVTEQYPPAGHDPDSSNLIHSEKLMIQKPPKR